MTTNVVSGTLNSVSTSQSTPFVPYFTNSIIAPVSFNLVVSGTFVATWVIQRSTDGGTTWVNITSQGSALSFTGTMSEVLLDIQSGVQYAIAITAYTSGTLSYRFSQ